MHTNLCITRPIVGALLVLTLSLAGCLWNTPITATVDDYAVSPDGSQIAIVVFSGREYIGHAEVRLYAEGNWEPVTFPFDMYSARIRFLDNDLLQVIAIKVYAGESTRFVVDVQNRTYLEHESWPREVVDYVAYGRGGIIATRRFETQYDLVWANGTAITDFRFEWLRDLEIVGGVLYFSKDRYFRQEGTEDPFFRPGDESHPSILVMNLTTMHVDFAFTAEQEKNAGVTNTLQHLCANEGKLFMVDGGSQSPDSVLYSFEPGTNILERITELPFGGLAPCVRGPHVYFIKVTGSHRMPEELWRMDLQGDELVKFAP